MLGFFGCLFEVNWRVILVVWVLNLKGFFVWLILLLVVWIGWVLVGRSVFLINDSLWLF